jgi:hypothetical protein
MRKIKSTSSGFQVVGVFDLTPKATPIIIFCYHKSVKGAGAKAKTVMSL